jgi:hypothetical protein
MRHEIKNEIKNAGALPFQYRRGGHPRPKGTLQPAPPIQIVRSASLCSFRCYFFSFITCPRPSRISFPLNPEGLPTGFDGSGLSPRAGIGPL